MTDIIQYLPYFIDGILAIVFIACVARGISQGLVGTLAAFAVTCAGIILIHQYSGEIVSFLIDRVIHENLCGYIAEKISAAVSDGAESVLDALPRFLAEAAENSGITSSLISESAISDVSVKIATGAEAVVITPVLTSLLYFLTYLLTSGINMSLTKPIGKLANHIPIVGTVNKLLGGIFGAAEGTAAVLILAVLTGVVLKFIPTSTFAKSAGNTILLNELLKTAEKFIR